MEVNKNSDINTEKKIRSEIELDKLYNQNYLFNSSRNIEIKSNIKNIPKFTKSSDITKVTKLLSLKEKEKLTIVNCNFCKADITKSIEKQHIEAHPSKILDFLYIGSYENARNLEELKLINIKCILNCAMECKNMFMDDFTYKKVTMTVI